MKKMNNKRGFTLAELLIVVAIIAVLVAIAIPIFTSQAKAAKDATDLANVRAAYAEAMSTYLTEGNTGAGTATSTSTVTLVGDGTTKGWTEGKIGGLQMTTAIHTGIGTAETKLKFTFNEAGVVSAIEKTT